MPKPLNPPLYLDRLAGTSVQGQIAAQIATRINIGLFRDDQQLPPVRALARQLDVDLKTVAKAYALLARLNLVVPEGKAGTRVLRRKGPAFEDYRDLAIQDCLLSLILTIESHGFGIEEFCQVAPELARRKLRGVSQPNEPQTENPPPDESACAS